MEARIKQAFKKQIYEPLLKELDAPKSKLKNSKGEDELKKALDSGRITFYRGAFRGAFTSTISKHLRSLGGKWDRKTKSYKLLVAELPPQVRAAVSSSANAFEITAQKIDKRLQKIMPAEFAASIRFSDLFDQSLWHMDDQMEKSLKGISVFPKLTDSQRGRVSEEWQENMQLFIKNFTEKEITDLRKTVLDSTMKGDRYESLIGGIMQSYGVSQRKAKFLARQETKLLLSTQRDIRYVDAGLEYYRWRCVKGTTAHPVRPMHKALDGKIFRFDDPPVTAENGAKNNPGFDYNCRCFPSPLVNYRPSDN